MNVGNVTFGSVCSGIEAASVAWGPLGWRAAWFSEIEAFPSAVLARHYPLVPNLGDMALLPAMLRFGLIDAPDVLAGGTPCQAFSVAGLRQSLADDRGNLSLVYCEIADAIDRRRAALGQQPCVAFWENVPGVLSTADNAFGCFLAELAGEGQPLEPPGGKWLDAGCVFGPARAVAWRVLDAQFFGLAQRRRRVFVVASARAEFDPAAVLLEFDGVRRDLAPSREAREGVAGTLTARAGRNGGCANDDVTAGRVVAFGGNNTSGPIEVAAAAVNAHGGSGRMDFESETFLVPGTSLQRSEPLAFDPTQVTSATNRSNPCHTLAKGAHAPAICFSAKDYGADATTELAPTLRAGGHAGSHANAGVMPAICFTGDRTHALNTCNNGKGSSEDGTGRGVPTIAFHHNAQAAQLPTDARDTSVSDSLTTSQQAAAAVGMQVRRLTPRECERLQGFPDDYTLIAYRGKPAADGPRYKALGNSWAVPVVRWIGARINGALQ